MELKDEMIIKGDCIQEMKKLKENSIDAIITDPPYGIGFMGKEWDNFKPSTIKEGMEKDKRPKTQIASTRTSNIAGTYDNSISGARKYQEFCEVWSKEAIRILKPGGFMLVSCSTRMYHRLVCGIEDAGFEIRDTIMWLYGSGFPKSLNIGKQIDKMNNRPEDYPELRKYLKEKRAEKGLTIKQVAEKLGVYQALYGFYEQKNTCSQIPSKRLWGKLKETLDLDDRFDELIARIEAERKVVGKNNYTIPKELYQIGKEKDGERDESLITAPNLPEAKQWEGWGTALKPACEPIVVARKPLSEKNVALNVLKWGTGGINIDECRIGNEVLKNPYAGNKNTGWVDGADERDEKGKGMFSGKNKGNTEVQGRFPANIILDEEAGKMLDEQSGIEKGNGKKYSNYDNKFDNAMFNAGEEAKERTRVIRDKGGASRFFYCAKASKSERNLGCEDLEKKQKISGNDEYVINNICPKHKKQHCECGWRSPAVSNHHPTVKPIKLMEYLVKLVSKEGATVLDPFLGSGTTAIACLKLKRNIIGIEKEEEYIKIAKARIKPYLEQTKLT